MRNELERIKTFIQGLEQDGLDSIEYAEVICCNEMSVGAGTTNTTTCNNSYNDKKCQNPSACANSSNRDGCSNKGSCDGTNNKLYENYSEFARIREPDVIFGGRLGLYRYLDMDKTILEAMKVAGNIIMKASV